MNKKTYSFLIGFLPIVLIAVLATSLVACSSDKVVSIAVDGEKDILVGQFDYADYKLVLTYESGKTETIDFDKTMISNDDYMAVFSQGEKTLTVNYSGLTCDLKLNICLYEFSDLKFEDMTVVYTGQNVVAEVSPTYPEGTVVYYPEGNTFLNVGTYDVTAIVSRQNYVTKTLTAKVEITQAEYDMSGVTLENAEFDYDGREHSIEIKGNVPDGITVEYEDDNNVKVNAGVYDVVATFKFDGNNYKPIPAMTAKMTINKNKYDTKNLTFEDKDVTYDGIAHTIEVENCPDGVSVDYEIYTEKRELVSATTPLVNAGKYYFKANFYSDNANYEEIEPMEAVLEIKQAKYDVSNIVITGYETNYDGKPHSIDVTGGVPADVSLLYAYYTKDGEDIKVGTGDNWEYAESVTEYGYYTYTALFECEDQNYMITDVKKATLVINKIDYDTSKLSINDEYEYTGNAISVIVNNIPKDVSGQVLGVKFTYFQETPVQDNNGEYTNYIKDADGNPVNGVTDKGKYFVRIEFTDQTNENYNKLNPIILTFSVVDAKTTGGEDGGPVS